jgi:hypothetical protein
MGIGLPAVERKNSSKIFPCSAQIKSTIKYIETNTNEAMICCNKQKNRYFWAQILKTKVKTRNLRIKILWNVKFYYFRVFFIFQMLP